MHTDVGVMLASIGAAIIWLILLWVIRPRKRKESPLRLERVPQEQFVRRCKRCRLPLTIPDGVGDTCAQSFGFCVRCFNNPYPTTRL